MDRADDADGPQARPPLPPHQVLGLEARVLRCRAVRAREEPSEREEQGHVRAHVDEEQHARHEEDGRRRVPRVVGAPGDEVCPHALLRSLARRRPARGAHIGRLPTFFYLKHSRSRKTITLLEVFALRIWLISGRHARGIVDDGHGLCPGHRPGPAAAGGCAHGDHVRPGRPRAEAQPEGGLPIPPRPRSASGPSPSPSPSPRPHPKEARPASLPAP